MSLNFKLDKIKNYTEVCHKGEELHPVTNGLIWSTMTVGLGEITAKNIDEWLIRLALADKLFGTMMFVGSGPNERQPRPFTREELVAHIGLTTNVSNETRNQFTKRQTEHFYRDRK